jgi:hypothetical protein
MFVDTKKPLVVTRGSKRGWGQKQALNACWHVSLYGFDSHWLHNYCNKDKYKQANF